MFSKQIPVLSLLTGALIWGLLWYPYRVLAQSGISAVVAATFAYIVALGFGVVFLRRHLVRFRFSGIFFGIALVSGLCNFGYVLAVIHGEVMRVLLLFYLAPFWTVFLARIILAEKPSLYGYAVIAFSVAGAMVMLWNPASGMIFPRNNSEWLGLAAGFLFASTNVLARFSSAQSVAEKSISFSSGMVAIGLLSLLFFQREMPELARISSVSWLLILAMGICVFAVNFVVLYGIDHVSANQAIVIMLFELVVAAISSYFLAGESMGIREWAGGAMIVTAGLFSGKLNS